MEINIWVNILKKNSDDSIIEHFGDKEIAETYKNVIPMGTEKDTTNMLRVLRDALNAHVEKPKALIGLHQGFSGFSGCIVECNSLGNNTFQCFIRNNRNMKQRTFTLSDFNAFNAMALQNKITSWVIHASYVMNPASYKDSIVRRTIDCIAQDMGILCNLTGTKYYVLHPGSSTDNSKGDALRILVDTMKELEPHLHGTHLCLENMAGQGTQLLATVDECEYVLDQCSWLDLCLDTCHMFGAGVMHFDFTNMLKKYDRNRLGVIHVNDSKADFGTRLDRHENIGYGKIPKELLNNMLVDLHAFNPVAPIILETPGDKIFEDLEILKTLLK